MKKWLLYTTLTLSLLCFLVPGMSGQKEQSYKFVNYSNKEGFDQNTVRAIEQDKLGIYWLGTANGLIKFDGYSFQNVSWDTENKSDNLHMSIRAIKSDKKGLLWIISRSGLDIYYPSLERFFKITSDSELDLNGLTEDASGSVWVFGNGYVSSVKTELRSDSVITKWLPNLLPEELADLRIMDLLEVNEGFYLLATNRGIYKMSVTESETDPDFKFDTILNTAFTQCLLKHNDIIWIGAESGLHKTIMDGRKLHLLDKYIQNFTDPESIRESFIRDMIIGPNDRLWVGTWGGGLTVFNNEDGVFYNFLHDPSDKDGISSSIVNCMIKDQFNVLWIGTGFGGLSKLDLTRKPFINIENNPYDDRTIPGNLINWVLEDSQGYLWISTIQNPLSRSTVPVTEKNINNLTFKRFNNWFNTFSDKNIRTIYEDKHGLLWLGYNHSLVVYDRHMDTFTEIAFDKEDVALPFELGFVNYIGAIDQEKIMIAGAQIIILDNPWPDIRPGKTSSLKVYAYLDVENVITVEQESPDKIWIGDRTLGLSQYAVMEDSLVLIKSHTFSVEERTSINNNSVYSIHKDSEQVLWVGTFGGGLNRLIDDDGPTKGVFEHLQDTLDMNDNAVYGIIEENDSILWLSTDQGICRLNKRNLETLRFNMEDGIASNNFRRNAYHKGRSGFYYFGGLYGLTLFKPEQIKPNLIPPEIILNALRINNKKVTPGEPINKRFILENPVSEISELVLTKAVRTLALDVIVMHPSINEKNSFSYMLEGFDEEWMNIQQGSYSIQYTNLPPGKYNLLIKGFNCDGIISENVTSLDIIMLAPWYAQLWSILMFALFGLLIIIGITRYVIKLKNLQNSLDYEKIDKERIEEINKAKLNFFTNISHEFKTPLSLISIPLQKLQELVSDNEHKKHLAAAEKNTNKLIRLIDQLLTFRKIEDGMMELKLSKTSMDDFLYPIAEAFESLSLKKDIEFHYLVKDPDLTFAIDLEKFEQVIYNLLSNAFKFTPPRGKITLEGRTSMNNSKQQICFEIKDTGKGIPEKDLDKIYDRFYQSSSERQNMGTGIGLFYVKSIVELHDGMIHVDSTPGKGSIFSVKIPFSEKNLTESDEHKVTRMDPLEMTEFKELASGMRTMEPEHGNTKETILIVDDEADFRMAIKDIFKDNFKTLEASNGKDALDITREDDPDLIISDVMMPVMNGYDLCNSVKTDIELCHIPVILLTVLEDMENHIQGVEYGADSYITKPFNLKYLEVNVLKLIENRKKIKEHFSRNHSIPKNIRISGIDREFIERVNDTIRQNLDDSSFGVEDLAKNMNLSTSHFYRKLKLLIGQIPNVYIRNYRLQTAAELISNNPGISIKTVMYEVGFESASHFSHSFKKKYGLTPSEFSQ